MDGGRLVSRCVDREKVEAGCPTSRAMACSYWARWICRAVAWARVVSSRASAWADVQLGINARLVEGRCQVERTAIGLDRVIKELDQFVLDPQFEIIHRQIALLGQLHVFQRGRAGLGVKRIGADRVANRAPQIGFPCGVHGQRVGGEYLHCGCNGDCLVWARSGLRTAEGSTLTVG